MVDASECLHGGVGETYAVDVLVLVVLVELFDLLQLRLESVVPLVGPGRCH